MQASVLGPASVDGVCGRIQRPMNVITEWAL